LSKTGKGQAGLLAASTCCRTHLHACDVHEVVHVAGTDHIAVHVAPDLW
jgi:hypothetical protein